MWRERGGQWMEGGIWGGHDNSGSGGCCSKQQDASTHLYYNINKMTHNFGASYCGAAVRAAMRPARVGCCGWGRGCECKVLGASPKVDSKVICDAPGRRVVTPGTPMSGASAATGSTARRAPARRRGGTAEAAQLTWPRRCWCRVTGASALPWPVTNYQ